MLTSFWGTTCPVWCAAYNCSNSSKNNPGKTLFTLPKNEYTRKGSMAVLNQKEGTSVQSQHTNVKSTFHRALFYCYCAASYRQKTEGVKFDGNTGSDWFNVYHAAILAETNLEHLQHLEWSSLRKLLATESH